MRARYWPDWLEPVVSGNADAASAAQLAANFIRSQLVRVYVGGFQTDRQGDGHRRFSGSAVNFLPLARFE